ncbi:MAG: aldehyde dehydrogenase family protein, partial [Limnobacter sp.]|nr:aldehyde dehydrogenase family protein [Limnobacter sp.]
LGAVFFTGSNATARTIQQTLAARPGPIVPLVAETGGVNAMVVDSSALPEQACDSIVKSAFGSAGQRCSALRIVFVQEDIAASLKTMVQGAMALLRQASPPTLESDLGPLIDEAAARQIQRGCEHLQHTQTGAFLTQALANRPLNAEHDKRLFAPQLVEVSFPGDFSTEIFGPVLQWVMFKNDQFSQVLQAIEHAGWGLTLGLQSRSDRRAAQLAALPVGNLYVNREMTGAVVGSQPFGGQGLSGTGPKAGGFHTVFKAVTEKTVSNNLASSGGIPELFQ